ncbi:MerR family transcriptional regulator [Candidatus Microgenomates bacterium]|nr:MerR family transcriptional regulator [Candidatus Microgenomates bacterium]
MDNLISSVDLVKKAQEFGFSFGVGDPMNLIRYYSSINLIPKSVRKQEFEGSTRIVGFYPESTVYQLVKIQELQKSGLTLAQIKEKLFPVNLSSVNQLAQVFKSDVVVTNRLAHNPHNIRIGIASLIIGVLSILSLLPFVYRSKHINTYQYASFSRHQYLSNHNKQDYLWIK